MRRRHGRRLALPLAGLLSALLIFSGCVTMEFESEFNEDGSATHSMELTLDRSQLEDFAGEELEGDPFEDFEEIERGAEAEGFRVERIDEDGIVGVRLIQEVEDSSDLGAILNKMLNAGADESEYVEAFSGTFEKDGDDFRLNLTVDGSALTNTAGDELNEGEDGGLGDLGFDMSMIFEFNYVARLPGEIDEDATNGRIGSDGRITWEIPLEGSATFTAASSVDDGGSNLWLILVVIGIVVLGLLALAAVAFFIFLNRRRSQPVVATPITPAGPAAPGATPPPAGPTPYQPGSPTSPPAPPASSPQTAETLPPAPRYDPDQPTERFPSQGEPGDDQAPERKDDEPTSL